MNPIERELKVLRGFAACAGDDARIDEAEIELARLLAGEKDKDEALDLLVELFDAYENGPACYQDPDEVSGYLGNATEIDEHTFKRICSVLNRLRPVREL